jgi:hypothetical protein
VVSSMTAPSTAGADVDIVVTDTTKNQGSRNPANTVCFHVPCGHAVRLRNGGRRE